ncbi:MAG: tRNA epoxyqueuosine(34) reductase QueG [Burkholderiaceae bacterium]|nr:tRNA epoxyqueuosine(34) reductase QueG [Burkholderiaceae bacterium]
MAPNAEQLILIAQSLGFGRIGVVDLSAGLSDRLAPAMARYREWLAAGHAGEMDYLSRHAELRANPAALMQKSVDALRAIVVTLDYLPTEAAQWRRQHEQALSSPQQAVISVYAHGRDYHKVMRQRLLELARQLGAAYEAQEYQFRACVDSAPVLEVELARQCGLGWRGKHTLLLNRDRGSMFFLGVLLTDMPLVAQAFQPEQPESTLGHCGSCTACLDVCPTQALLGPYQLDARRCISYLTIELKGSIPLELRPLVGNHVYGCDDCQQVCPWNHYARRASLPDFDVRHGLDGATLIELFSWSEQEFLERHQGSAILRIGVERWLRNLAVAMGNALRSPACSGVERAALLHALAQRQEHPSALVREHVQWALSQELQHDIPGRNRDHRAQG